MRKIIAKVAKKSNKSKKLSISVDFYNYLAGRLLKCSSSASKASNQSAYFGTVFKPAYCFMAEGSHRECQRTDTSIHPTAHKNAEPPQKVPTAWDKCPTAWEKYAEAPYIFLLFICIFHFFFLSLSASCQVPPREAVRHKGGSTFEDERLARICL